MKKKIKINEQQWFDSNDSACKIYLTNCGEESAPFGLLCDVDMCIWTGHRQKISSLLQCDQCCLSLTNYMTRCKRGSLIQQNTNRIDSIDVLVVWSCTKFLSLLLQLLGQLWRQSFMDFNSFAVSKQWDTNPSSKLLNLLRRFKEWALERRKNSVVE